jgi:hypothetical protein
MDAGSRRENASKPKYKIWSTASVLIRSEPIGLYEPVTEHCRTSAVDAESGHFRYTAGDNAKVRFETIA